MLAVAALSAIGAVLVWMLWALPIARSLEASSPGPLDVPVTIRLATGERAGVWMDSAATAFATSSCSVIDPTGAEAPTTRPPALEWSDVLWWVSDRPMFQQVVGIEARRAGEHIVRCAERTGWLDGEILVARDSFGGGAIGLGRTGAADFATGTILVFCAAVLPLLAAMLLVAWAVSTIAGAVRRCP